MSDFEKDNEITRISLRIPEKVYEMIQARLDKYILQKSMNTWILEQIIDGLNNKKI